MSVAPNSTSTNNPSVHWLTVHRGKRLTLDSLHDTGVHAYGCLSTLGDDGAVIGAVVPGGQGSASREVFLFDQSKLGCQNRSTIIDFNH